MGGRGSGSGMSLGAGGGSGGGIAPQQQQQQRQAPQQPQQVNLQPGSQLQTNAQASATLAQIMSMSDDQLAQVVRDSRNVDMPNFLNDKPDPTQKFVYQAGLNGAPTVMDQQQFNQFMQQNNIPKSQILARSVNANGPYTENHIADIFKYSELNYIGGKFGGMMSGAGTYFDMNGGRSTGYGSGATLTAVLNPKTARVVDYYDLQRKARAFAQSHPKFVQAVGGMPSNGQGGNMSVWALAMGYNVISGGPVSSTYHNIIDRSAVIVLK
jgi:hypothetical protein